MSTQPVQMLCKDLNVCSSLCSSCSSADTVDASSQLQAAASACTPLSSRAPGGACVASMHVRFLSITDLFQQLQQR